MARKAPSKPDPGSSSTATIGFEADCCSFGIRHSGFGISPPSYWGYAVKQTVKCIEDDAGNGFIWHTTDSGKTLTSFKASTLLKPNEHIHNCLFVVDRKHLDRQTREAFAKACMDLGVLRWLRR